MGYECAFYLNNLGIACFQQGCLERAIECLKMAMGELPLLDSSFCCPAASFGTAGIPTQDNHTTAAAATARQSHRSPPARDTKFTSWVKINRPDGSPTTTSSSHVDNNNEASMYSYALVFSTDCQNWPHTLGVTWHATSAILLYNLALVDHWRAIHMGISSVLPMALHLYEQAGDAIQQLGEEEQEGFDHLALALLNNMGHIHYQLLQFGQASECFHYLRLHISVRVGSITRLQSMEDYETFVLSAMLSVSELQLAPAA